MNHRRSCVCSTELCRHWFLLLTLSLPKATVVEFTVHCQTRLQSKFKGTVDSCLFFTVIRDATFWYFKMYRGHNNIVYGGLSNFLYKNGFYKNVYKVIRFRGNQKFRKHFRGDDIQDALSTSTAIFWFISDETIYQSKTWCLIIDVDVCFIYFLHKIAVYRHFNIFYMASELATKGHATIFFIIGLN